MSYKTTADGPDFSIPSIALVASNGKGKGRVLEHDGAAIAFEIEQIGGDIDAIGLVNAPMGLSIWTGNYVDDGPGDWPGTREACLDGEFRPLTEEEWERFACDEYLWDREPYESDESEPAVAEPVVVDDEWKQL